MRLEAPQLPASLPPAASYHPPDYRATWGRERYGNLIADSLSLSLSLVAIFGTDGIAILFALPESIQSGVNTLSDLVGADESMHDVHEATKVFSITGMIGGLIFVHYHVRGGFEVGFALGETVGDVAKVGKSFTKGPSHFIHDGPLTERMERFGDIPKVVHDLADDKEEHDKAESPKPSEEREVAPQAQPHAPAPIQLRPENQAPPAQQGAPIHLGSSGNDVHSGSRGGGPIFDGGGGGGKYGGMA